MIFFSATLHSSSLVDGLGLPLDSEIDYVETDNVGWPFQKITRYRSPPFYSGNNSFLEGLDPSLKRLTGKKNRVGHLRFPTSTTNGVIMIIQANSTLFSFV